jgi:hypothetical protein
VNEEYLKYISKFSSFEDWWNKEEPFGYDNTDIVSAHKYFLNRAINRIQNQAENVLAEIRGLKFGEN